MELFVIYAVTRLTELKEGLWGITLVSGILLALTVVLRLGNELFTSAEVSQRPPEDASDDRDVFLYQGIRRSTKRGLWWFAPVFLVFFSINLFLPTTRDAVVIAGGYGLVEAVKNERVQKLFTKSAAVASHWLDEQLNGEDPKTSNHGDKKPAANKPAASASQASAAQ